MNLAEALARQLVRVTEIRQRRQQWADLTPNPSDRERIRNVELPVLSSAIYRACSAIGSGDPVQIEALGSELECII